MSVEELIKNQRNHSLTAKCAKSVYSKPWDTKKEKLKEKEFWMKTRKAQSAFA